MDVPDLLLGQHSPGLQGFPLRLLCRWREGSGAYTADGRGGGLKGPVT